MPVGGDVQQRINGAFRRLPALLLIEDVIHGLVVGQMLAIHIDRDLGDPFGLTALCQVPLPTASATLHWATIELPRASYCWSSCGHGECADTPGPEMLLRTGDLKPYRTAGGFEAKISFHSTSTLKHFDVLLMVSPEGTAGPATVTGPQTFAIRAGRPRLAGFMST